MNFREQARTGDASARGPQGGVALAITLLLLMVLTLLGTTGLVAAVLELRMAANAQYQQRAFEAAEFGIEQAMHSPGLTTSYGYTSPKLVPDSGAAPAVPGSPPDSYSYRLYYDTTTDASGGAATHLKAYHFVVEATGTSARGATDTHVQGFYVLGPEATPASLTPPDCAPACGDPTAYEPRRTFWLQMSAD
jgi:type IV pilus assembly protein PilX